MAYTYEIPDNFVETGRVIHGMFETKAFIEGCVLGGIGLLLGLLIPIESMQARISELIICAGPGFALGIMGINGDRVYTTLLNMRHYAKQKKIMFYDGNPRALVDAPVDKMMDEVTLADQILQFIDRRKQEKLRKKLEQEYIYGENFEFAEDTDYARDYIDPDEPQGDLDEEGLEIVFDEPDEVIDDDEIDIVFDENTEEVLPFIPFIHSEGLGIGDNPEDDIPVITIPTITIANPDTEDTAEEENALKGEDVEANVQPLEDDDTVTEDISSTPNSSLDNEETNDTDTNPEEVNKDHGKA